MPGLTLSMSVSLAMTKVLGHKTLLSSPLSHKSIPCPRTVGWKDLYLAQVLSTLCSVLLKCHHPRTVWTTKQFQVRMGSQASFVLQLFCFCIKAAKPFSKRRKQLPWRKPTFCIFSPIPPTLDPRHFQGMRAPISQFENDCSSLNHLF
jgi:hypothetical protein